MSLNREFSVKVPIALVEKFERIYPAYGSKQWFFSACMESVVELFEKGEIEPPEAAIERVVREADIKLDKRF